MLVLTRKIGETILIGDQIAIRVLRIDGNQLRLGLVAPPDMNIARAELVSAKTSECPNCREHMHNCRCSLADAQTALPPELCETA